MYIFKKCGIVYEKNRLEKYYYVMCITSRLYKRAIFLNIRYIYKLEGELSLFYDYQV